MDQLKPNEAILYYSKETGLYTVWTREGWKIASGMDRAEVIREAQAQGYTVIELEDTYR